MNTFETFNNGKLVTPAATKDFSNIPWSKHPKLYGRVKTYPDIGRN